MVDRAQTLPLTVLTGILLACAPVSQAPAPATPSATPAPIAAQPSPARTPVRPPLAQSTSTPSATLAPTNPGSSWAAPASADAMSPQQADWPPTADLIERPLAELSPAAATYLADRAGTIGLAVVVPAEHAIYTAHGDQFFHMASVAKLVLLLALLDRSQREDRALTPTEQALVEPMITVSDNDAATALWAELGGADGVASFLHAVGLSEIVPNRGDAWGRPGRRRAPSRCCSPSLWAGRSSMRPGGPTRCTCSAR